MIFSLLLFAFSTTLKFSAHAEFLVPPLTSPVEDPRHVLSSETRRTLERALKEVKERRGLQVQVLIVDSLEGLTIEEASLKVVEAWKLGSAKKDDGVLLMIAMRERRVRIEVGQGLEGVLPDVIAGRIVRNVIVPRFKEGDPDRAVSSGVYAILQYALGEAGEEVASQSGGERRELAVLFLFLLIGAFLIPLFNRTSRLSRWRGPGHWGGGGFGGGGFGGGGFGGGGGWSGGGGGFSGGGASGGW